MKKVRVAMMLICVFCIMPSQASLFPPLIESLCQPTNNVEESDTCLRAKMLFLESVLKTIYAQAFLASRDKNLVEREQAIFESLRHPKGEWYSMDYDCNDLLTRIIELATLIYPQPVFPEQVLDQCKKYGREYNMEPRNCDATHAFIKKAVQKNYKEALEKVQDKEDLKESQQEWLNTSKTICDFGNYRDVWQIENDCTYYWNLLRADELAKMANEGKFIPGALDLAFEEQNYEWEKGIDLASASKEANLPNPFSPELKFDRSEGNALHPDSAEPSIDLTDTGNVKRIQKALSEIYKWIPTKGDDLAAMHYAAIHDFQERNGLPVSNKITRNLLLELESAAYRRQQESNEKIFLDFDSPKYVKKTQSLLQQVGYGVPANGVLDGPTENAIKDFQSKNGVKTSGKVGPYLIQQLENKTHFFGKEDPLADSARN